MTNIQKISSNMHCQPLMGQIASNMTVTTVAKRPKPLVSNYDYYKVTGAHGGNKLNYHA